MSWGLIRALLIAFALYLSFAPARAEAANCTATVTDVDFGTVNLLSTSPSDAMATVSINCTGVGALYVLKMCPGIPAGSGGSSGAARFFTGPSSNLSYALYQDSARTAGWGSVDNTALGTVPSVMLNGNFSGNVSTTLTLYARMPGAQTASLPGSYTSVFAGQASFSYNLYLLNIGTPATCTGFVGAQTITPNFKVKAQPPAYCNLSANDLAFGSSGVLATALTAQTTLSAQCTLDTPYAVSLDNGTGAGATAAVRRMTSASGGTIGYSLYQDAPRTAVWGDAAAGLAKADTGSGSSKSYTVYGKVPVQATPAPGTYSDRIVVTVSY